MKFTVDNFQSLKHVELDIPVGFTAVGGPSNIGKSAIVRAFQAAVFAWGGFKFVKNGNTHCSIKIQDDDGLEIIWEKGKSVNKYKINGTEFDKPGRNSHPEIALNGFRELVFEQLKLIPQVHKQGEYSFLLEKTEPQIAVALSAISRAAIPNRASRICSKDVKQLKSKQTLREKDLDNLKSELLLFDPFEEISNRTKELQKLDLIYQTTSTLLNSVLLYKNVNNVINILNELPVNIPFDINIQEFIDLCDLGNKYNGFKDELNIIGNVKFVYFDLKGHKNNLQEYNNLMEVQKNYNKSNNEYNILKEVKHLSVNLKEYEEKLKNIKYLREKEVFALSELEVINIKKIDKFYVPGKAHELYEEIEDLREKYKEAKDVVLSLRGIEKEISDNKSLLEKEKIELSKIDVCPLCNRAFNEEHKHE